LRTISVRLARAGMGAVDYWLKLPIKEVLEYMNELVRQVNEDNKPQK